MCPTFNRLFLLLESAASRSVRSSFIDVTNSVELLTSSLLCSSSYPKSKLGAVLVLLYEDSGKLRVLLTTRAKTLRFQGGQTALPGGMFEESDKNLVDTAVSIITV